MARSQIQAIHSKIPSGKFLTFFFLVLSLTQCVSLSLTEGLSMPKPTREYFEQSAQRNFDALFASYGNNKQLPPGFELQALIALSHYPELRDTKINFIVDDVSIPLSSRPHWSSMLRAAKNRTYQVIIDSELDGSRGALLLKNQPFNAQVGILGHELAHTVYYLDRSFFGIASDAICQLSDCRINFERATDSRLIERGLGWQRFDHATFVRSRISRDRASAFTAEGGGGAYMSPAEILRIIESHESYAESITPSLGE